MRASALPFLLVLGCTSGPSTGDDTDVDTDAPAPALTGVWGVVGDATPLDWMLGDGDLRFLVFRDGAEDGAGVLEMYAANQSGQEFCGDKLWARVTPGMLVVTSDDARAATSRLVGLALPEQDVLELSLESGETVRFARLDAVPADSTCGTAPLGAIVPVAEHMDYWSNLVWDGTHLRYTTEGGGTSALDPTTGELTDAWSFGWGQYQLPLTVKDGVPWLSCGCGRNDVLELTQPGGTVLGEVDTGALGHILNLQGATMSGAGLLWLYGGDGEGLGRAFMAVDVTTPASPALRAWVPTDVDVRQLVLHDGVVWGAHGDALVRVDPATGLAGETLKLVGVRAGERVAGMASDGATLWVVLDDGSASRVAPVTLE